MVVFFIDIAAESWLLWTLSFFFFFFFGYEKKKKKDHKNYGSTTINHR